MTAASAWGMSFTELATTEAIKMTMTARKTKPPIFFLRFSSCVSAVFGEHRGSEPAHDDRRGSLDLVHEDLLACGERVSVDERPRRPGVPGDLDQAPLGP